MDEAEAKSLLAAEIAAWRSRTYADLVAAIGDTRVREVRGDGGAMYQIEAEVFWDSGEDRDVRVLISIDDGGWRAFVPLADSFVVAPDGRLAAESRSAVTVEREGNGVAPLLPGILVLMVVWPFFINDFYLIAIPPDSLSLVWSLELVFHTAIPAITLWILLTRNRICLETLGLSGRPRLTTVACGVLLGIGSILLLHWNVEPLLVSYLPAGPFEGFHFPASGPERVATISYVVISAALLEETIFRGLVLRYLESQGRGVLSVVVLSSLFFGLGHWSYGMGFVITAALWAVIPAAWAIRSRQVWGPIAAHLTYNALVFAGR